MKKLILISALSILAMADYTLTIDMGGSKQKFYYKDNNHMLVENSGGNKTAQLFKDGKLYMVTAVNGKKRYMDMSAMLAQMSQMGSGQESFKKPKFEIISRGKSKIIAGVKAQEWTIKYKERGRTVTEKVFVSNNNDLRNALEGFSKFMSKMAPGSGLENMYEIKDGYVLVAGDGFKITKLDKKDLPDTLFAINSKNRVPSSLGQIKKPIVHIKKPPVCAIVGKHGKAKMLLNIIKPNVDGWKLIDNGTCSDMMGMHLENALYQKGDGYIHLSLSINDPHNQGLIDTYKVRGLSITGLKRGKLQGYSFQKAHLDMAGVKALDIKLPNAMLELTATDNVMDNLEKEANNLLNLSKFKPVKHTKPNPQDALKDLGKMFGGGNHQNSANMPSQKDLQKMQDMMKQMIGR